LENFISILNQVGLSEKEARVYLAMLESSDTSASNIARISRVKRTTVYSIIELLENRGLVRRELRGIKDVLIAESPEKLEKLIAEKKAALGQILPALKDLESNKENGGLIKIHFGIDALKLLYLEMIELVKPGDDYYILSNIDKWSRQAPDFFSSFVSKRGRLNIKVKHILVDTEFARLRSNKGRKPNEQFKFLPQGSDISTNLVVTPQRILTQHFAPNAMALTIDNKAIIQTHLEMFRVMWNAL
jgi:sugar-specific transcriptional regulator TrmB